MIKKSFESIIKLGELYLTEYYEFISSAQKYGEYKNKLEPSSDFVNRSITLYGDLHKKLDFFQESITKTDLKSINNKFIQQLKPEKRNILPGNRVQFGAIIESNWLKNINFEPPVNKKQRITKQNVRQSQELIPMEL